jgi:cyclohexyl-isocyanide hydratase
MDVLPLYGAIASDERVVIDGTLISAGGVTSGIDGSLVVVSLLRGETVAYDPHPPFQSGSPATASADILATVTERARAITEKCRSTGRAYQTLRKSTSRLRNHGNGRCRGILGRRGIMFAGTVFW